jgi:hypothetical protein
MQAQERSFCKYFAETQIPMLCLAQKARRSLSLPLKTLRSIGCARFPKKRGLRHELVL